jgi:hypothetical protein
MDNYGQFALTEQYATRLAGHLNLAQAIADSAEGMVSVQRSKADTPSGESEQMIFPQGDLRPIGRIDPLALLRDTQVGFVLTIASFQREALYEKVSR